MSSTRFMRCAALVSITSILLVVEGVSRINLYSAAAAANPGGSHTMYPPAVQLVAAVGLSSYGLAGLANALFVLLLGAGNSIVTLTLLAIEFALGWFFFSVFVLSAYPFMVARAVAPMPGLTGTQSNALIMMGFLGAMGVGIPILASHFYFTLQLARFQRNEAGVYTARYSRARVYFYGVLVCLKGIGELSAGAIVNRHLTNGMLAESIADVPFIITWGSISIADGSQVLLVGLLGIAIAGANLKFLRMSFAAISFFSFAIQLALFATTQIGITASNPLIVGSILVGNTFTMMFMPAYLVIESGEEDMTEGKDEIPPLAN